MAWLWVPWSLQTEQYSGVELFCSSIVGWGCQHAAVAGWGCQHAAVAGLQYSHSSDPELLYAADTGNDYNYCLEERRDRAVSRVVCSVLFFVLLRHVML